MATSLSRQLASIAATSTNQLDLRAQRHLHSQSLLFDPKVAATQDFDTIYDHCVLGFQDICRVEPRFLQFSSTLFNESSKTRERGQLTQAENAELNIVIERFLTLSCKHLLLQPTQKALEWLIRRFRVHEFNTETLVFTFLVYHPLPIFSTLLSILPKKLSRSLKFLHPYRERLQAPSAEVIQHATNANTAFHDGWTTFVLKSCKWGFQHEPMLSYWTIRTASAIESQLEPVKIGGAQAQRQKEEDVVRRVTAILDKALSFRRVPSILIGCFVIIERLVPAANLNDTTTFAFMDAIVTAATPELHEEAITALVLLSRKLKTRRLPQLTFNFVTGVDDIVKRAVQRVGSPQVEGFAMCLTMELIHQLSLTYNVDRIRILSQLLTSDLLQDAQLEVALRAIVHRMEARSGRSTEIEGLSNLLLQISGATSSAASRNIIKQLSSSAKLDPSFTAAIQATEPKPSTFVEDTIMEDTIAEEDCIVDSDSAGFVAVDGDTPQSYLANGVDDVFGRRAAAFTALLRSPEALQQFIDGENLGSGSEKISAPLVSFLLRYASSHFPHNGRALAISCISNLIRLSQESLETQLILPYTLVWLADSSTVVRNATTDLLSAMESKTTDSDETTKSFLTVRDAYGVSEETSRLSNAQFRKILQRVLVPRLEECKMDRTAIKAGMRDALSGSSSTRPDSDTEKLKKQTRTALLGFLAEQARAIPILRVISSLVALVSGIQKRGNLSISEAFKPLLEDWLLIKEDALRKACTKEALTTKHFCIDIVGVIPPSSMTGHQTLQKLVKATESSTFIEVVLEHVIKSWASMSATIQNEWAVLLFESGVLNDVKSTFSDAALETLRSLQFSTEVLQDFVERVATSRAASDIGSPNVKRRRTNNGTAELSDVNTIEQLKTYLRKCETLLTIIRNTGSALNCTLLPGLFKTFQIVHKSKSTLQNELTYVYWLFLTCLREVVERSERSDLRNIDNSDMRVDLVVDTLTHTTDLQTQYAALMLLSALAKLDPELIIHSMMPVFTFMGSNILKQDNDHATYVIDQTIDSVIPPLIESFKQHKGGALSGASGLISSFVAAFEHILPSRRINLFSALIDKLGAEEYLAVLFVVLQDRYGNLDLVEDFLSTMLLRYPALVGLKTIQRCIEILEDSLKARPMLLKQIFVSEKSSTHEEQLSVLAELPIQLLRVPQLPGRIYKGVKSNMIQAEAIRSSYADMVQSTLKMTVLERDTEQLSGQISSILGALVVFFPVSESLRALDVVLQQSNEDLNREVLHSFAIAINRAQAGDVESRDVALKLLPRLVSVVDKSDATDVAVNALKCINGIIEKYGKTDTSKTLELTGFLVGPHALQSQDLNIQLVSIKTVTTIILAIGEEIIPMCPTVISTTLNHLSALMSRESWNTELHNAIYSLFTALLTRIPWMVTGTQLDRFLELSYISASTSTDTSCDEKRITSLLTFAENASPQTCFEGLSRNWSRSVELAGSATSEHLQILETTIDKHSKATIINNAKILTDQFMEILNLRASKLDPNSEDWGETQVDEVEEKAFSIYIKMVYKMNDTHFRPQFVRLSEWATSSGTKNEATTIRRLTTWFAFLQRFFETLQSIVINYATYIVEPAVNILTSFPPDTSERQRLWEKTNRTLHATFEHDRDDFWKSHSRFSDVCGPLINQIAYTSMLSDGSFLIPCVTAFAMAVDSAEQRAEIHAKLLQHSKSEDAQVRRAMFSCEISLTEALGDEWISLFDSSSTYPVMSEALEDDDEDVENEVLKWKRQIEEMTGESLDTRLQ